MSSSTSSSGSAGLSNEPVGSGNWKVRQGQCLESIALDTGHFWQKLWDLPENQEIKDKRQDPNTLLPGDLLSVPPIEEKQVPGATEQKHTFRRKGVPSILKVQCLRLDEPLADLPYRLVIDGKHFEGQTDSEGRVEQAIPPDAKEGCLIIREDEQEYEYELELGHLDPIETITGIKARLSNLGFDPGTINDREDQGYTAALARFQEKHELEVTGEPDQDTRDKLEEIAG